MFSLICVWINDWVNNREAGDLRRYRAQYDVIVMSDLISAISPLFLTAFDAAFDQLRLIRTAFIFNIMKAL